MGKTILVCALFVCTAAHSKKAFDGNKYSVPTSLQRAAGCCEAVQVLREEVSSIAARRRAFCVGDAGQFPLQNIRTWCGARGSPLAANESGTAENFEKVFVSYETGTFCVYFPACGGQGEQRKGCWKV